MNMPSEFAKVRADLASIILPALYIGMPIVLLIVGILMFCAGFYFHMSRHEDEAKKKEQIEREMVHKLVRKLGAGKSQPGEAEGAPAEPGQPAMEEGPPEEEAEPAPEEEAPEEEAPSAKTTKAPAKKRK
jgi:type IV secretory pathway VirB10-like protein